jgi:hypothetical protein
MVPTPSWRLQLEAALQLKQRASPDAPELHALRRGSRYELQTKHTVFGRVRKERAIGQRHCLLGLEVIVCCVWYCSDSTLYRSMWAKLAKVRGAETCQLH